MIVIIDLVGDDEDIVIMDDPVVSKREYSAEEIRRIEFEILQPTLQIIPVTQNSKVCF